MFLRLDALFGVRAGSLGFLALESRGFLAILMMSSCEDARISGSRFRIFIGFWRG